MDRGGGAALFILYSTSIIQGRGGEGGLPIAPMNGVGYYMKNGFGVFDKLAR
jgi:hypothetical protein